MKLTSETQGNDDVRTSPDARIEVDLDVVEDVWRKLSDLEQRFERRVGRIELSTAVIGQHGVHLVFGAQDGVVDGLDAFDDDWQPCHLFDPGQIFP